MASVFLLVAVATQTALLPPSATASFIPLGETLPPLRTPVQPSPPPAIPLPAEGPLWDLLNAGHLEELQRTLRILQRRHPTWRPSAELRKQLQDRLTEASIGEALRRGRPLEVITLAQRHPGRFGPERVDRNWALAKAYHARKQPREAERILRRLLDRPLTLDERMETLRLAKAWLPSRAYMEGLARSMAAVRRKADRAALEEKWLDAAFHALHAVAQEQRNDSASRLITEVTPVVIARRDGARALSLAWLAHRWGDRSTARNWFERAHAWDTPNPDAAYGLAMLAYEGRDPHEAERWARQSRLEEPEPRQLLGSILLELAGHAFQEKRYEACVTLTDEAETYRSATHAQTLQRAWALYHMEETERACQAFRRAFGENPSEAAAEGLFYSHLKAGRLETVRPHRDMPLSRLFRRYEAQSRFYQKQFLSALALAPEEFPSLQGLDGPTLGTSGRIWNRSGVPGTSQLQGGSTPALDMAWTMGGRTGLRLQVDRHRIDSGPLDSQEVFGSSPRVKPGLIRLPAMAHAWVEPRLTLHHADGAQVEAMVGLGFLDETLSLLPSLDLSMRAANPWGPYGVRGFFLPVQDSLLSWVGTNDPYEGSGWGRAYRLGMALSQEIRMGSEHQVTLQGLVAHLEGDGVAANQQATLEASLQRLLRVPQLDFGVLGAQVRYETYRQNLSHFTMGHGGYYSPQTALGTYLTWDARTLEALPWMVAMHLETGPAYQHLAEAPYFPLAPDGRTYPGASQWIWGAGGELKALYQLGEHLQVGTSLQLSRTPAFVQQSLLFTARYTFRSRKSVVSSELP